MKTSNNKPCPACTTEVPKPSNRAIHSNCDDCYAKTNTWESEELKAWQCGCYAVNHKKEDLKGYTPIDEKILKLIEVERATEKNQIAKEYQQNKIDKEYDEQIKYAEERPRVVLDE